MWLFALSTCALFRGCRKHLLGGGAIMALVASLHGDGSRNGNIYLFNGKQEEPADRLLATREPPTQQC